MSEENFAEINHIRNALSAYLGHKRIRFSIENREDMCRTYLTSGDAADIAAPFILVASEQVVMAMGMPFAHMSSAIKLESTPTGMTRISPPDAPAAKTPKFVMLSTMTVVVDAFVALYGIECMEGDVRVTEIPLERLVEDKHELSQKVFGLIASGNLTESNNVAQPADSSGQSDSDRAFYEFMSAA